MGLMKLLSRPTQTSRKTDDISTGPLCDDPCAEHILRTGGYCKLLSESHLWENDAVSAATELLQREMAFVPAGPTHIQNIAVVDGGSDECGSFEIDEGPFLIDRYAVTNSQFQRFIDADGYRDESFWPVDIQPFAFQFVDLTGVPGPSQWKDGSYDPAKRDHPVVGVSWHEANAFASWTGKCLPTSSQWQRAGTWWDPDVKYTWGNSYEHGRANVFSTRIRDTVSVDLYGESATPNGIVQLVGNVWEWIDGCFAEVEFEGRMIDLEEPLGEIRGGAYDTYLASQASCLFRSGQALLGRTHNVGFRCAASADFMESVETES